MSTTLKQADACREVWPGVPRFLCLWHLTKAVGDYIYKNCKHKENATPLRDAFKKILYFEPSRDASAAPTLEQAQSAWSALLNQWQPMEPDMVKYLSGHWG